MCPWLGHQSTFTRDDDDLEADFVSLVCLAEKLQHCRCPLQFLINPCGLSVVCGACEERWRGRVEDGGRRGEVGSRTVASMSARTRKSVQEKRRAAKMICFCLVSVLPSHPPSPPTTSSPPPPPPSPLSPPPWALLANQPAANGAWAAARAAPRSKSQDSESQKPHLCLSLFLSFQVPLHSFLFV